MTPKLDGNGSAAAEIRRDDAWRRQRIALAAYFISESRGFEPGHEDADWLLGELQTNAIDAGRRS
jgi:hypothetical protein